MPKWDDMSPRERDALVAEKVMGWSNIHETKSSTTGGIYYWGRTHPTSRSTLVNEYTTDISAAWEVVDVLSAQGLYVDVFTHPDFYIATVRKGDGTIVVETVETTAPGAISRVSLLALGVDV